MWIPVTIAAAAAQTLRFMLQRHLAKTQLSAAGVTFARFLYSAPLVALLVAGYLWSSAQSLPVIPGDFWIYALGGGLAQILGTILVIVLFSRRNFAIGITFKKTEVLLSVITGLVILGEGVSPAGFMAILLGFAGVLLIAELPGSDGHWMRRIFNRSAGLGLASGLFFALSGVGYRGATLALDSDDAFLRATVTLACVTAFQTAALGLWLLWRERGEIARVLRTWRVAALVGLTSLVGSVCWFTAYALQTVAYVNALGQVELIFSLFATMFFYAERISRREWQGLVLLSASIVILVLVT